jgi:hypothetical protein
LTIADGLVKFDAFLIDRGVDPVSHWVLARWGKSCFWLERQAYAMAVASYVLWTILSILDGWPVPAPGSMLVTGCQILVCLILGVICRGMVRQSERREWLMRRGWINETRVRQPYQRLLILATTAWIAGIYLTPDPFLVRDVFAIGYFVLLSVGRYLAAGTPPPPAREEKAIPAGLRPVPQ